MKNLPLRAAALLIALASFLFINNHASAQFITSSYVIEAIPPGELLVPVEVAELATAKPKPKAKPVHARQVLIVVQPDCENCDQLLGEVENDFEAMRGNGWKIGSAAGDHVRIVEQAEVTELRAEIEKPTFPQVLAVRDGKVLRSFTSGCSTPLDMWTFDWLMTGLERRPVPPPIEPVTVPTSGNYPLRGGHWSVDYDWHPSRDRVLRHLRGPNHARQIRANWYLETWTVEELKSLHDNLHELDEYGNTVVYSNFINAPKYRPVSTALR